LGPFAIASPNSCSAIPKIMPFGFAGLIMDAVPFENVKHSSEGEAFTIGSKEGEGRMVVGG
jgi:hypothetical protein